MGKAESGTDVRRIYRALALDKDLDGVDPRVFLYLFSRLDFENYMRVPQIEIAEALGRHKEHVSRSIRKLKGKDIIFSVDKVSAVRPCGT